MKQNSSILFHSTSNSLKIRCLCVLLVAAGLAATTRPQRLHAAEQPEYLASFQPAKGFKAAQRDLTEVFLQLAASLEAFGSPEPYLRHVAAEHGRIESLYRSKYGKNPRSFRPDYMTDAYLDKLSANWKLLSPKLGLDAWAKDVGHMMRDAIKGTRGTGTIVIEIFNQHQSRVFDQMAGKANQPADFEQLKDQLITRLELNNTAVDETGFEVARRDAVTFALGIHGVTMKLFKRCEDGLKPDAAQAVKTVITSIILDTGQMAHSELQTAIAEWATNRPSSSAK
jgi:hypothetical protein